MLSATIVLFASLIWGGLSHSFHSLEAARITSAFTLCLAEVLPAIIVKDLFFLHERGWWMGVCIYMCQTMPSVGIIASSFLITAAGWRWHLWVFFCFIYKSNDSLPLFTPASILF
jgi:hypothetical protein